MKQKIENPLLRDFANWMLVTAVTFLASQIAVMTITIPLCLLLATDEPFIIGWVVGGLLGIVLGFMIYSDAHPRELPFKP